MKRLAISLIKFAKPLIWRLAEAFDIKVERPLHAYGQYPLRILDKNTTALHNIPKSVYFNTRSGSITIGKGTVFGEDVKVLTGKHYNIEEAMNEGRELQYVPDGGRDIIIGAGCYIGSGAIIIGPLEIGDYAVIGAGSVVTKSMPACCFAAGVPAKKIRMLLGKANG